MSADGCLCRVFALATNGAPRPSSTDLLIAGIAAVIVLVIVLLGGNVLDMFRETSESAWTIRTAAECDDGN